jgi:hypothetical protein
MFCVGKINLPPDGNKLFFEKGSIAKIKWTLDEKIIISKTDYRAWYFKKTGSNRSATVIASIYGNNGPEIRNSSLPDVTIENRATLVLENVDRRYNGKYQFSFIRDTTLSSEVTVVITGKPKFLVFPSRNIHYIIT